MTDLTPAEADAAVTLAAHLAGHPIDDPLPKTNLTGGYEKLATAFNHEQVTA